MKYAIGLFGIHYQKHMYHWMPNWVVNVNYKNVIDNNQRFLYGNLNSSFYSSTYFSEKTSDLICDFKFRKLQLTEFINEKENYLPNRWIKRNLRLRETIKLILDDTEQYDFVILTRFDLIFKKNIFEYSFNNDKINLICKSYWNNEDDLADDNFYFMKFDLLQEFYDNLLTIPLNVFSHHYNRYITNFHYLIDKSFYNNNIPAYKIDREYTSVQF